MSCSNYEHGYFSGYRHLTDENPEFVLFLGDYIYDTIEENRPIVRRHTDGVEATTLPTYRNRYAQYRLDPDWRACMRRCRRSSPGTITRCRTTMPTSGRNGSTTRRSFCCSGRRPIRRSTSTCRCGRSCRIPKARVMRVYDRFTFGDLIEISMIDGRQYRSREACYGPPNKGGGHLETNAGCPERLDPPAAP